MKKGLLKLSIVSFNLLLSFLLLSTHSHATVYKWVDANGQVHYSDREMGPANNKAEELKLPVGSKVKSIKSKPIDKQIEKQSSALQKQPASSSGRDKSQLEQKTKVNQKKPVDHRCALARKVVNGEVKLANGLPFGEYEIEVAKRDIQSFCD